MKISTKGRYALTIMIYLAQHYEENRYITLKEISQKEGISLKYLEKIIFLINKASKPKDYHIYEIIAKAEGDIAITTCLNASFACCKRAKCRSYKLWNELNDVIVDFLKNKTLDEYIKES